MKHLGTLVGAAATAVLVTVLALSPASAGELVGDTPTAPETTQSGTESTPSDVETTPVATDPLPSTEEAPEDADGPTTPTDGATPPADETLAVSADTPPSAAAAPRRGEITVDSDATVTSSTQLLPNAAVVSILREGCTVTVTVTAQVADTYLLKIWDDGQVIGTTEGKYIEAGGTTTFTYVITQPFGDDATGVGLYLETQDGTEIHEIEWDFNNSTAIITASCASTPEPPAPTPPSRSGASKPPVTGLAQTGSPIAMVAVAAVLLAGAGILIRRRTS